MTRPIHPLQRALAAMLAAALALTMGWPALGASVVERLKNTDRVRIEIDGVSREIADNVRGHLTLGRYVERTDLTDSQVRRLAYRAADEAADALRPFGYYAPTIRSRTSRDDDRWIVRLRITPGEPVRMETVDVQIAGRGADEAELLAVPTASPLKPGTRLDHPSYEKLKTDLMRTALSRGYLDAKLTRHDLVVDPPALEASAYLTLETGGRYRFGEVTIEQDVIDDALLTSYVRFAPGKPFSNESIRATQYALEDSNYFSDVTIVPGQRDPETLLVPVTIRAEPIKRDRYTVSFGYGTDTQVRGRFAWENRRVNTRGHRSRIELIASAVKQEALARYIIPVGDPSLEKLEFVGGYINEQLGDVDSERWELTAGLTQAMGKWQRVLFLKLNDERSTFPDGTEDQALLLIPGFSYASQPPNYLTGWVRDSAYYGEISGSPSSLGSDSSYLRFYGRAERVWSIREPWYLRLRGELGTSWVDDFSSLPASQRFFAGGDRSVRGFALDSLSPPADPPPADGEDSNKGVGGEHKLVASIELERDFPRNIRGAVFFDAGNAFNDWSTPLEYSVGIGVRWRLPMLLIGLDVAQALSEDGANPRIHLNITQVM